FLVRHRIYMGSPLPSSKRRGSSSHHSQRLQTLLVLVVGRSFPPLHESIRGQFELRLGHCPLTLAFHGLAISNSPGRLLDRRIVERPSLRDGLSRMGRLTGLAGFTDLPCRRCGVRVRLWCRGCRTGPNSCLASHRLCAGPLLSNSDHWLGG